MRKSSYKQTAVGNIGSLGRDAAVRLVPPDCPSNMAMSLRAKPVHPQTDFGVSETPLRIKTA